MTNALMIPEKPGALAQAEPRIQEWLEGEDDAQVLAQARRMLQARMALADRTSEDAAAARRLDILAEWRLGQMPELAPKPRGGDRSNVAVRNIAPTSTPRAAASKTRALGQVPKETVMAVLAGRSPSRAKVMDAAMAAAMPNTQDPTLEESARAIRAAKQPGTDAWPRAFDVSLLDRDATQALKDAIGLWRDWCDEWEAALVEAPTMRRVK